MQADTGGAVGGLAGQRGAEARVQTLDAVLRDDPLGDANDPTLRRDLEPDLLLRRGGARVSGLAGGRATVEPVATSEYVTLQQCGGGGRQLTLMRSIGWMTADAKHAEKPPQKNGLIVSAMVAGRRQRGRGDAMCWR